MPHALPRATSPRSGRRAFLRGAGTLLALPGLEILAPRRARAAGPGTTATGAPLRAAFLMVPNGVNWKHWHAPGRQRPLDAGETFDPLGSTLGQIQLISGLGHDNANAKGDGAGDHARANATYLTACHARKTAGADIRLGISVDQVAARRLGHLTRLPSLELGSERSRRSGACDSGYSCAYQFNLSWASETAPLPPEPDPRKLFERIFGAGPPRERARAYLERQRARKSIVDFALADAKVLSAALGANDRHKLGEYLGSVREIEREIEKAERFALPRAPGAAPDGIPEDHGAHLRLMFDLLALAFQTDTTRIATFPLASEGSNRGFPEIGIAEGHHHLSHHEKSAEKLEKVARIDRFYAATLTHFLRKLDAATDADGKSLLHNTMVLYGCAIGDGDKHDHDELPVVLAGGGGGRLRPGRRVRVAGKAPVPLANLFLTMLGHLGIEDVTSFGDSTGRLDEV